MDKPKAIKANKEITKVDVGGRLTSETEVELADKLNELIDKFNKLQRKVS